MGALSPRRKRKAYNQEVYEQPYRDLASRYLSKLQKITKQIHTKIVKSSALRNQSNPEAS